MPDLPKLHDIYVVTRDNRLRFLVSLASRSKSVFRSNTVKVSFLVSLTAEHVPANEGVRK